MKKFYDLYYEAKDWLSRNRIVAYILSLGWLVAFVFAIKTSVLDANNIPSQSMEPTLMIGDFLFVNKMRYTFDLPYTNIHLIRIAYPERGDIITFTPPQDSATFLNKTLVKRVVGVPGDTVEVQNHEVTVSGVKYPVWVSENPELQKTLQDGTTGITEQLYKEKIIDPKTGKLAVEHYIQKTKIGMGGDNSRTASPGRKWVIPFGKYLVMGDNRDHSADGRTCEMVDFKQRDTCFRFNLCLKCSDAAFHRSRDCKNYKPSVAECRGMYEVNQGPEWGLIDAENIHGKVYLSYLSVNWGTGMHEERNPIVNLLKTLGREFKNVYVRWERTFRRIY